MKWLRAVWRVTSRSDDATLVIHHSFSGKCFAFLFCTEQVACRESRRRNVTFPCRRFKNFAEKTCRATAKMQNRSACGPRYLVVNEISLVGQLRSAVGGGAFDPQLSILCRSALGCINALLSEAKHG